MGDPVKYYKLNIVLQKCELSGVGRLKHEPERTLEWLIVIKQNILSLSKDNER